MDDFSVDLIRDMSAAEKESARLRQVEAAPSVVDHYLGLPGIRFYHTFGVGAATPTSIDLALGVSFAVVGAPLAGFVYEAPFTALAGAADGWQKAASAQNGFTGAETYNLAAARGIAIGAWVYFTNTAAAVEAIVTKRQPGAATIQYALYRTAGGNIMFEYGNGVGSETVTSTQVVPAGQWTFVAGRWRPSTSRAVFVNNRKTETLSSAYAAVANNASKLCVGCYDNGAGGYQNWLNGMVSQVWGCCMGLSDALILGLFNRTRHLFRV